MNSAKAYFKRHFNEDMSGYTESRIWTIVNSILDNREGKLLDAACGFGNPYVKLLNYKDSVGIDIDPEVVNKNTIHSEFIIQDLHELNTKLKFDTIISVYT